MSKCIRKRCVSSPKLHDVYCAKQVGKTEEEKKHCIGSKMKKDNEIEKLKHRDRDMIVAKTHVVGLENIFTNNLALHLKEFLVCQNVLAFVATLYVKLCRAVVNALVAEPLLGTIKVFL